MVLVSRVRACWLGWYTLDDFGGAYVRVSVQVRSHQCVFGLDKEGQSAAHVLPQTSNSKSKFSWRTTLGLPSSLHESQVHKNYDRVSEFQQHWGNFYTWKKHKNFTALHLHFVGSLWLVLGGLKVWKNTKNSTFLEFCVRVRAHARRGEGQYCFKFVGPILKNKSCSLEEVHRCFICSGG